MIAVIQTGGKQYTVKEGLKLQIEKLDLEADQSITFNPLLIADEQGQEVKVGTPEVAGAKVTAKVLEQGRDEKVSVIKYKRKVRYRRNVGHRQPFTLIQIEKITA
ncbi:50S ribosomal protein L21 [Patescibacteria group bacterium]|nr:50S ribosomal protein L21 [Patescibacteria group bacterium]MBU1705918.1 50S ribosomal protein L21 [Patescibacteria group bacterium]